MSCNKMQINYLKIIQWDFWDFCFRFRLSQLKCTFDKKLQTSTCFVSSKHCPFCRLSNTCSPHCICKLPTSYVLLRVLLGPRLSRHRLRGHYHFYTTGYQHIQIMIYIFSFKVILINLFILFDPSTRYSPDTHHTSMVATQASWSFVLSLQLPEMRPSSSF
jgi:hypothetical protein